MTKKINGTAQLTPAYGWVTAIVCSLELGGPSGILGSNGHMVKFGDVIEIPLSKGFAYAQYTHRHKQYGTLLRVLRSTSNNNVTGVNEVDMKSIAFSVFFPLSAAVSRGIVRVVGNAPIPQEAVKFPVFRTGVTDPATGRVGVWWLWDGVNEWRVGDLSSEQRKFPIRGIWNDSLLIFRIESGWTPEKDPS